MIYTFFLKEAEGYDIDFVEGFDLCDYHDSEIVEQANLEGIKQMCNDICQELEQQALKYFYYDYEEL